MVGWQPVGEFAKLDFSMTWMETDDANTAYRNQWLDERDANTGRHAMTHLEALLALIEEATE